MPEEAPEVTPRMLHEDLVASRDETRAGFEGVRSDISGLRGEVGGLRGDIAELRTEMRAGCADLKATLLIGFRGLPTRESSEEMVRLFRERNRLQEQRFAELEGVVRGHHLEAQEARRALLEGERQLGDRLSRDIRALTDALLRGGRNGEPPA